MFLLNASSVFVVIFVAAAATATAVVFSRQYQAYWKQLNKVDSSGVKRITDEWIGD